MNECINNCINIINKRKIQYHRLFPKINNINLNTLKIDDESVSYITIPNDSKRIISIISNHLINYKNINNCIIADITAGVGGDSINFCNNFKYVISIELDIMRYNCLKHNINVYGFTNSTILNGNSIELITNIPFFDIIYIDPPWGGRDYKNKEKLTLKIGCYYLEHFILKCFNLNKVINFFEKKNEYYNTSENVFDNTSDIVCNDNCYQCIPKIIVMKLPKNYDLKFMYTVLSSHLDIYLYEMNKINIIIIEKKDICENNNETKKIIIETLNDIIDKIDN